MSDQVQIVERVFAILEYLSLSSGPKGPTEIANATGLHKSTVYRILNSMCKIGYVEKTDEGSYYLGIKLVEIVSNHINSLELQTEARPFLYDLRADLGLIVHLGILSEHEVVYVEKLDINHDLRMYTQIGLRVPAYCSSLGKCLLSSLSGEDVEAIIYGHPLIKYTSNTITSIEELKNHLREVRLNGWAMDNEEYIIGHRCVAAPIFDYRGHMIAAVSASGPVSLLSDNTLLQVIDKVKETAKKISHRLCYDV